MHHAAELAALCAQVRQLPLLLKEQALQQRCDRLQRLVGGMLQPFVRASQVRLHAYSVCAARVHSCVVRLATQRAHSPRAAPRTASQLLKGGGKSKKGGVLLGGLELSSEEEGPR